MSSKKGGKKVRRVDNIDDFLEKALAKPQAKRASKPLVRSDLPKDPGAIEARNTMIQLKEGESMFAKLEERKRAKERAQELIAPPLAPRLPQKDEEPEEVYDEDFEEEIPEPPKKPLRPSTPLVSSQKKPQDEPKLQMSIEEINRLVQQETLEARKREEEENKALELKLKAQKPAAQMVVQKSASDAPKPMEQKTKKLQEKRNAELLEILQFESFSEAVFDLQSMNEYDSMMRKLQQNEAKHSSTQWNDDYLERDTQTNDVDVAEKTTQWPEDMSASKSVSIGAVHKFLKKVLPVIEAVLEENNGGRSRAVKLSGDQSTVKYISSTIALLPPTDLLSAKFPGLAGTVSSVVFFPSKSSLVAVSTVFQTETIVFVWDLQVRKPTKVLSASSTITSLCVSSTSEHFLIAGTSIGSLLLWDLRENSENHPSLQAGEQLYTLREATYSTEGLTEDGHCASVERILELEQAGNRSFQVASVDSTGVLISWSVIEMPTGDEAGSEFDLGLRIGGRMKLVKGTSTSVVQAFNLKDSECSALAFDPSNVQ